MNVIVRLEFELAYFDVAVSTLASAPQTLLFVLDRNTLNHIIVSKQMAIIK